MSSEKKFPPPPHLRQVHVAGEKTALKYTQFSTRYDSEGGSIWVWMQPKPRPCLNARLIDELVHLQQQLTYTYKHQKRERPWPFRNLILASGIPGIYNLGGDLDLFKRYILTRDEASLKDYAYKCINLLHGNINNLDLPISMISLVQGQALGGGFETSLSCDVIIAERGSLMGFPEIIFNLFPGMGAYNLLARRIGASLAERIILSGQTYKAEELYDMGVIDVLAEEGKGVDATYEYLKGHNRSHNTIRSMKQIRQIVHPITEKSLFDIVDIWLDSAMALSEKDLFKMDRLLQLQKCMKNSHALKANRKQLTPRRGDWRKIKNVEFPLTTHLGEHVLSNRRKNGNRRRSPEPESIS